MGIAEKKREKAQGKNLFSSFILFVLILHPSSFILSARASYTTEIRFQESLRAFKKGDYRNAMLGFMDVVAAEPENGLARNYLGESGRKVLEREEESTRLRGKNLLQDAEAMRKRLRLLEESKQAKIREWGRLFSRAEKLAGDADSLPAAVSAYEEFLRKTPVYAGLRDGFSEKEKIIQETFYRTIKDKYPDMVLGRTSVNEADLGGVFFMREALNDFSRSNINTGRTESILAKASQLNYLRRGVRACFDDEIRALELYSGGKFAQAQTLFRKVLRACGGNEETAFYSGLADERLPAAALSPPLAAGTFAGAAIRHGVPQAAKPVLKPPMPAKRTAARSAPAGKKGKVASAFLRSPPAQTPAGRDVAASTAPQPSSLIPHGTLSGGFATGDTAQRFPLPSSLSPQPDPEAAGKLYEQGVREFSVGNYAAAGQSWSECLRLEPGHTKAKLGMGRLKARGPDTALP